MLKKPFRYQLEAGMGLDNLRDRRIPVLRVYLGQGIETYNIDRYGLEDLKNLFPLCETSEDEENDTDSQTDVNGNQAGESINMDLDHGEYTQNDFFEMLDEEDKDDAVEENAENKKTMVEVSYLPTDDDDDDENEDENVDEGDDDDIMTDEFIKEMIGMRQNQEPLSTLQPGRSVIYRNWESQTFNQFNIHAFKWNRNRMSHSNNSFFQLNEVYDEKSTTHRERVMRNPPTSKKTKSDTRLTKHYKNWPTYHKDILKEVRILLRTINFNSTSLFYKDEIFEMCSQDTRQELDRYPSKYNSFWKRMHWFFDIKTYRDKRNINLNTFSQLVSFHKKNTPIPQQLTHQLKSALINKKKGEIIPVKVCTRKISCTNPVTGNDPFCMTCREYVRWKAKTIKPQYMCLCCNNIVRRKDEATRTDAQWVSAVSSNVCNSCFYSDSPTIKKYVEQQLQTDDDNIQKRKQNFVNRYYGTSSVSTKILSTSSHQDLERDLQLDKILKSEWKTITTSSQGTTRCCECECKNIVCILDDKEQKHCLFHQFTKADKAAFWCLSGYCKSGYYNQPKKSAYSNFRRNPTQMLWCYMKYTQSCHACVEEKL